MRKNFQKTNFWLISTLVLGTGFIISLFFDINFSITSKGKSESPNFQIKGQALSSSVSAAEIYQDLVCSCCGKTIGDCTCGMAAERRAFVDEQLAQGLDERRTYKEATKKYGVEILFDQVLAAELKEEVISEAPKDRPIISVEPENVDLGEVSMAQGEVEAVFTVKNVGKSDLIISGMETSCGCTTASLKIGGQQSPIFGMHDNPTDWSGTLSPGQETELVVIFDSAHHGPEGTGPATRTISVKSNDPIESFKKVQFEANVIK